MAVTSFINGRYLTSIYGAKEGDRVTLSVGNPIRGGEFTTYLLGAQCGESQFGEPLFDLDEAQVQMGFAFEPGGEVFVTRQEIREFQEATRKNWSREAELRGIRFRRTSFGHWARAEDQ